MWTITRASGCGNYQCVGIMVRICYTQYNVIFRVLNSLEYSIVVISGWRVWNKLEYNDNNNDDNNNNNNNKKKKKNSNSNSNMMIIIIVI